MGWKKNNTETDTKIIFDVKLPDMDFSLDDVFGELKNQLKEEKSRNSRKVKKRGPPKSKVSQKKIVEQKNTQLKRVEDIAPTSPNIERAKEILSERTPDPLALANTPRYMTQREFQNHYKLLLDRIQVQLSSLGGGGAVNIRDMEDIDPTIFQDPESLDGAVMRMQYNSEQKILEFYGDNSFVFNNRSLVGTADEIIVELTGERFNISLAENIVLPGTIDVTGVSTFASDVFAEADINVTGKVRATKFTTTSDERLKTNINKIQNPLDIISGIEGVTYNWISDNSADVGVIAQDVERCLPDAVHELDGVKGVNYNGLIGLLVESVKELSKDNRLLKLEVENLKRKI